jgi:hypothetical protein
MAPLIKPRHAAALALVGWYLMAPPIAHDSQGHATGKVLNWLPLSSWEQISSFDTAKACEDYQSNQVMTTASAVTAAKKRAQTTQQLRNIDADWGQTDLAKCVASDDPRLKSK